GSVTLNPPTVAGGNPSTGTVTLTSAALPGGAAVPLSSNNAVATVPSSVTVAGGATTATFTINTSPGTAPTPASITATFGGVQKSATLTVVPLQASGVSLNPATVVGGNPSTGTVTLNGSALAGGASVALSSSNTAVAGVPASVTVLAGNNSATFTITTSTVTSSTPVTITADFGGGQPAATLTVAPLLGSLALDPTTVVGGNPSTGTVALNGPAPAGGTAVALASTNAAASVPASVTVPAGASSVSFTVTTSTVSAAVSGSIPASFGGAQQSASLTVVPLQVTGFTLNPTSVVGGNLTIGTVLLNGPVPSAGGAVVTLTSGNSAASVPSSVTIGKGGVSANVAISTSSSVTTTVTGPITASYNGSSASATLTVVPPLQVSTLTLNLATVVGGSPSTGTVALTAAAPAGGVVVSLSSG